MTVTLSLKTRAAAITLGVALLISSCSSTPEAGTASQPATTAAGTDIPDPSTIPTEEPAEASSEPAEPTEETEEASKETEESDEPVEETTEFPELTVETDSPDALAVLAAIDAALLTPEDVGNGFVQGTYTAPDPTDTTTLLPCGQVSTAVAFPNALRTGTTMTLDTSAQLEQGVSYFLDAATATDAFAYGTDALACSDAELNGVPADIGDPQDVTEQVGGDLAAAWEVTIGADSVVLIAVLSGSMISGYTFIVAGGVDTATLPNPLDVAAFGTQKLLAAGL